MKPYQTPQDPEEDIQGTKIQTEEGVDQGPGTPNPPPTKPPVIP